MTPKALIDTNILVYAYEYQDPPRQQRALEILTGLMTASAGVMSVKTLSEFFVVVRRIPNALTTEEAFIQINLHASIWPILDLTPSIVIQAARGVKDYGFSYWDAQMWATAQTHKLNAVFTEDMNVGSQIEEVSIINPLAADFNLQVWLSQTM